MVRFTPDKKSWGSDSSVVEQVRSFGGDGVDVAIEMSGYNSSVNNAIQSVRRGGNVVLFGIKSGNFTIEDFSDIIVRGVSLHSVIGRHIFETWDMTTNLLESEHNRVQQKIYDVILNKGKDTIVDIDDYDMNDFEERILTHPKLIIKW